MFEKRSKELGTYMLLGIRKKEICSFVMMSSLNNVYQQILGDKYLYLIYFGLNLVFFFLIYGIYWIATYIGFKRNINEES